jgi:uncharacterized protein (TIGR02147 family)
MKTTIRERIQAELDKRKLQNSSYSLRALARDLNLNHSLLSRIIASKIQMTPKIFERIAEPLKLTQEELLLFQNEIKQRKNVQSKEKVVTANFRTLEIEEFKIVQDWYNFAILEMVKLDGFQPTPEWISKKLNISVDEASLALERLVTLKLLQKKSNGTYEKVSSHLSVMHPGFTAASMKERQKAVLFKAIHALENLPIDLRDNSSMTLSIDSSMLPEIKEKIKKMRRSLANNITDKSKKRDQVYELSISFFPWTTTDEQTIN